MIMFNLTLPIFILIFISGLVLVIVSTSRIITIAVKKYKIS